MGFDEREVTGHAHVHLDSDVASDASGTQVVHLTHARLALGDAANFGLYVCGKAFFHELVHSLLHDGECGFDDE